MGSAGRDERVRVIVVTGAGKTFCPGLDLDALQQSAEAGRVRFEGRPSFTTPRTVPKPIIAAINGGCAGIGIVLALVCDVRFAARRARFSLAFSRRGLVAEQASSWLLPRLLGTERAFDLLVSGRTFSADEALATGLVSRVTDDDELMTSAITYATELATSCSPLSMAVIKQQLYADQETDLETARRRALALVNRFGAHPDLQEGIASFREKRTPGFRPLPGDWQVDPGGLDSEGDEGGSATGV
jgi:enoyl-CoA hydratase/carnithine racemase